MERTGILVFDDVEELDLVGPLEVFGMAKRFRGRGEVLIIAESSMEIRCRYGLRVRPTCSISECRELDVLIVPGGLGARTHARKNPNILEFVCRQQGIIASVCTGALILAAAGVLKDLDATTHHSSIGKLREYTDVRVHENVRLTMNERVATSAGVSAGIDLSLALVARLWGMDLAERISSNMEWDRRGEWRQFAKVS